jgi:hypothetical protein
MGVWRQFWCAARHSPPPAQSKEFPARMATSGSDVRITEDDMIFLLSLLRNAAAPLTTEQLVEALKQRGR